MKEDNEKKKSLWGARGLPSFVVVVVIVVVVVTEMVQVDESTSKYIHEGYYKESRTVRCTTHLEAFAWSKEKLESDSVSKCLLVGYRSMPVLILTTVT